MPRDKELIEKQVGHLRGDVWDRLYRDQDRIDVSALRSLQDKTAPKARSAARLISFALHAASARSEPAA